MYSPKTDKLLIEKQRNVRKKNKKLINKYYSLPSSKQSSIGTQNLSKKIIKNWDSFINWMNLRIRNQTALSLKTTKKLVDDIYKMLKEPKLTK